jgi:hypothetical protein
MEGQDMILPPWLIEKLKPKKEVERPRVYAPPPPEPKPEPPPEPRVVILDL